MFPLRITLYCPQNQCNLRTKIFRNGDDLDNLNIDQQYYSKSAERTQNLEEKLKEDGKTEKYQINSSVLNTKENPEYIVGESNSIYFNTETEKPQNFNEEYYEEVNEECHNNEFSENSRGNNVEFNLINHLGLKRRNKSVLRLKEDSDTSENFEKNKIIISPKN